MESVVVYGMLAYFVLLTSRAWGKRAVAVCGAAMIVLLIGFGRVYLGAHYVSDVVGGFAAGGRMVERRHHGMGSHAPA